MASLLCKSIARLRIASLAAPVSSLPALQSTKPMAQRTRLPRLQSITPAHTFTSSPRLTKSKRGSAKNKGPRRDPRVKNLKISNSRKVPPPLRFARNRHLRHWTIHRAWQLYQRKEREEKQKELERMYRSMHNACEELRKTSGPGLRDEGYLYRVAMEKKGTYGQGAIPIEYARLQTETPAKEPWDHKWTR